MVEMQPQWQPAAAPRQSMSGLALTLLIGAACVGGTLLLVCAGVTTLSFVGFDSWKRLSSRLRQSPVASRPQPTKSLPPWMQQHPRPSAGSPPAGFPSGSFPPVGFSPPTFGPNRTPPQSNFRITPSDSAPASSRSTDAAADDPFARANPVMSFPRRGQPTRVPVGSQPVTAETPLAVGDRVWAYRIPMWFPAEIVALEGADLAKIHYLGFGRPDELSPRTKLRLTNAADPSATETQPIEPDANSTNPFKQQ